MLNLRDEHLQQALKHAPDSELAPSEIVRKSVLNYANKVSDKNKPSQKPHQNWHACLLPNIKNWQWTGMSSVAVALLAVLMLREQLPEAPVWRDADVKEIAQNSAPATEKTLKEERADATEYDAAEYGSATPAAAPPTRMADAQEKAKADAPATASVLANEGAVVAAAPTVVAPEAQPVAPAVQSSAPAPAEQALAKQESRADAELTGRMESSPAKDAVASAEQKIEANPTAAAAKKSVGLVDAGALGVAKANRDIQAGVLRILVAEWPADKAQLDEATGYRVEVVTDLVPEELETYNQTMRDWYLQQK